MPKRVLNDAHRVVMIDEIIARNQTPSTQAYYYQGTLFVP